MDAASFLTQYGFDLGGRSPEEWLMDWKRKFPASWVASALVEALYRGRYKAVSVQQLLLMWQTRGNPCMGFSLDFGRKVWPEGLDPLQSGLEQGNSSSSSIRNYAFNSFDSLEQYPTLFNHRPSITMYPLRRQLRWESLPNKLEQMLCASQQSASSQSSLTHAPIH